MNENKTYNGYANYETSVVVLWLGNDFGTYGYWNAAARKEKQEAANYREVRENIWPAEKAALFRLADRIKEDVTEGAPELNSGLYSDLLQAALVKVDWEEVAEFFLAED
jgi:hypothetical protein